MSFLTSAALQVRGGVKVSLPPRRKPETLCSGPNMLGSSGRRAHTVPSSLGYKHPSHHPARSHGGKGAQGTRVAKGTKNCGVKPWWHVREAEGIQGTSGGWGEPGEGRRTLGGRARVGNTRGGSSFSQSFPAPSRKEAAGTPVQVLDLLETEKKVAGKERGQGDSSSGLSLDSMCCSGFPIWVCPGSGRAVSVRHCPLLSTGRREGSVSGLVPSVVH